MSTTEKMFDDEEVNLISADLKEWPNSFWGNDEQEWAISPFVTFYFLYDSEKSIETSLKMVEIHQAFEYLLQHPYQIATHPVSERPYPYGSKRLPDLTEFAHKTKVDDHFLFKVTSEKNPKSSPASAGYFWKKPSYMNDQPNPTDKRYSSIQLYYRWAWWKENQDQWRNFVIDTIRCLKPEFVYSGFSLATPLMYGARTEAAVWERALTTKFYGLDIDDPSTMERHGDGIRPPTWGFFLDDSWRSKLGYSREQVRDHLCHPEVNVIDVESGQWIELGREPNLYPVTDGIPPLLELANRLLRPIRNDHMSLVGFGEWEGDPNVRFSRTDSMRWLGRFDSSSDWPTPEERHPRQQDDMTLHSSEDGSELRAKAGEPCPRSGRWQSMDLVRQVRSYAAGDVLEALDSTYGVTVWRYLGH